MKCANHPEIEATWRCVACGRSFCGSCVKTLAARGISAAICPVCGGKCEDVTLTEEAAVATEPSFWERLPGIVIYPLRKDGLIILIVGAIFFAIADSLTRWTGFFGSYALLFSIVIWLVVTGYLCRYFLSVVYSSSTGDSSPPTWPDLEPGSFIGGSLSALFKFIAPAVLSYGAAAAYYFFGPREFDRSFVVLVIAGSLYYPMSLTAVALSDDVAAANPVPVIRSILRVPLEYLATSILFMVLLYLNYLRQIHLVIGVPVIGSLVRWFILLYVWTMAMHLLGMFYYTNRHRLQWT